ncbi:MAG: hypothetical protein ACOX0W_07310 [Sphaerochaetaceae bacterium]|jgi:hypothetical protein
MKTLQVSTLVIILVAVVSMTLTAESVIEQADRLYWADSYDQVVSLITGVLPTTYNSQEKSELLWRLSRATLAIGDEQKAQGANNATLFATFEQGQEYAEQAIEVYPLARAYTYRASNIGRWGETKGPLNSLSKAKPMRDDLSYAIDTFYATDDTIAWYVLGQLYYKLPGRPLSFGNLDTAISYARMAVDTIPAERNYPGHYKALAEMLWKRGLSSAKRKTKINSLAKDWNKEKGSTVDRYSYYEGSLGVTHVPMYSPVALQDMSDQQEAAMILKYAIAKYDVWPFHSRADQRTRQEIGELLDKWGL